MKIEGTGKTQGAAKAKKSGGSSAADAAAFGEMMASNMKETAAAATTQSIAMVDSLLAVQAAEDPAARAAKKRVRQRAEGVLKELDKIKVAMLSGNLTVGHMVDIADVVASHREKISDPGLTALLDEIDLRAQVELAKMRGALGA
ncbi:MAG: flagellar assembly protein FliX [Alphaproteobacteria bacterium]|nr:flagellar assembly protein FliX [Alphaproteobacteria bacterium]